MPIRLIRDQLILISGFPTSGKTYRSEQLLNFLLHKISQSSDSRVSRLTVHHISDQLLGLSRDVYATAKDEKEARATFSSAIRRALTSDTIVVADGLNYIKGFRYQLYCEAKAARTPSCVVHVGTPPNQCREWNQIALPSGTAGYESDVFENLVFRYEEPNGMNRWDAPLFTVLPDDKSPPFESIWEALVGSDGKAKLVRPNAATILQPAPEQNYLYELDKAASDVVALIALWQQDHPGETGGTIPVAGSSTALELPISSSLGVPKLQRLRRQFINLNRQHSLSKARLKPAFAEYLNDAFRE